MRAIKVLLVETRMKLMQMMIKKLKLFWQNIRELSGDDAYERYLMRHAEHHKLQAHENCHLEHDEPPLNREAFFKQWQESKWTGIKRCC